MSADLKMSEGSKKMRFHGQLSNITTLGLILACVAMMISPANANIIYVDANSTGFPLGTSWQYAYAYLQDALAVAQPGDTIRVAQGTYKPTDGVFNPQVGREATFNLLTGVAIEGGYHGNYLTVVPPTYPR